jgi:sugar phosphate isomerase/epimerase
VSVEGKNLDGKQLNVLVNGQTADVVDQKGGTLRFKVPQLPVSPGEAAMVVIQAGRESSRQTPLYLGKLPLVIEARPVKAMAGERVTLKGRGFDSNLANLDVTFGGHPALLYSASDNEIVVSVPGSGILTSQMDASVVVTVRGSRSNSSPFILTRPSSGYYVPHYFGAPVPDKPGYALVSTDIGPVLALGSPADAPSTAERAARAAAAMNAMVDEAQNKPVKIEVRDQPVLGIAIAGHGELLLQVTGDDLAAYGALDPTLRTRRVSQRNVAVYWAAMLQDHLALFVTRERPFHVVELSTRGRALMQIYGEALRRAGAGAGVPVGVVNPLPSNLGHDLQDMAFVLPTDGQSTAAAALEGRWVGTMWEEGQGEKAIRIRLRLEGMKLVGTLTTSAGAVGADIPLEDVGYSGGQLRFTLSVGGAKRVFQGQVQGATVAGEISPAGGGAKGRFSLRYAE